MLPYFIAIILVFVLSILADKSKEISLSDRANSSDFAWKLYVMLACAVLVLFAGLRYRVGNDYGNYIGSFDVTWQEVWQHIITFREPGFEIIAYLSRFIYNDYVSMFFCMSLFTVALNVKTISKYTESAFISFLLYIFIGAWHGSFNGIRQYAAAAIIFAGHRFILHKKFWKYALVVLLASAFHLTALIMLPMYFVLSKKLTVKNIIMLVVIAIAMRYSYEFFFGIMSAIKGNDQTQYAYMKESVTFFRILVAFAPIALALLVRKDFFEDKENTFYFTMLLLNATFMFATSGSAYLARVGIYTDIYATLAFPKMLKGMKKSDQMLLMVLILALYFIFWYYEVSKRPALNNFQFIWQR